MILVDVFVPSLEKTYDFELDEQAKIRIVIEEIAEMTGQKEKLVLQGEIGELLLCDREGERVLSENVSLGECGIQNGAGLILV